MYTVHVKSEFCAAVRLPEGTGPCAQLHGHTYQVEVQVRSPSLNEHGYAADFYDIDQQLQALLSQLDHQYLNDLPAFASLPPSAEHIGRWLYHSLQAQLAPNLTMHAVTVWEQSRWGVTYQEAQG